MMVEPLECYYEADVICPYCGEHREPNHAAFDGEGVATCPSCNREFRYERETSIEYWYTTEPVEGWPE